MHTLLSFLSHIDGLQRLLIWPFFFFFFAIQIGTIIQTLSPRLSAPNSSPPAGIPSTHVTIISLTSTAARLLTGSLSDLFAPTTTQRFAIDAPPEPESSPCTNSEEESQANTSARITVSRMAFLIPSAVLLALGFLVLASPFSIKYPELSHVTTGLVGIGYGSTFSLIPIIINVVWGVENFATNWGVVSMFPAVGAALWGILYSRVYQSGAVGEDDPSQQCFGWSCYGFWAAGCFVSVCVAIFAWLIAWRGWRRRGAVV